MAASLLQRGSRDLVRKVATVDTVLFQQPVRYSGILRRYRGKVPEEARSWTERVAELKQKESQEPVDIGFPFKVPKLSRKLQKEQLLKTRTPELEQKARLRQLKIPLDEFLEESITETGPQRIKVVAEHYGIYRHLFDGAYFYPQVDLIVEYDVEEEMVTPVFHGNRVPACEVAMVPTAYYESQDDELWTLCMVAPDSHLQHTNKEYLHWMIGNIPSNDIDKGKVLGSYLPPFPTRGTGFHRYVFILYKQKKHIEYCMEEFPAESVSLEKRTFSTQCFYEKHKDDLTPAGLAFFQSEWDPSITQVFWKKLDMEEPAYEFVHRAPYHPEQKIIPHKEPFDLYLDRYRDVKDIQEEVLREKLKTTHPFKPRPQLPEYPNIYPVDNKLPTWRRRRLEQKRFRQGMWKGLDD